MNLRTALNGFRSILSEPEQVYWDFVLPQDGRIAWAERWLQGEVAYELMGQFTGEFLAWIKDHAGERISKVRVLS